MAKLFFFSNRGDSYQSTSDGRCNKNGASDIELMVPKKAFDSDFRNVALDIKTCKTVRISPEKEFSNLDDISISAIIYVSAWFTLNILLTLYCKATYMTFNFPYPILMSAVHMLFTSLGVYLCQLTPLHRPSYISYSDLPTIFWFSFVFTTNIWLSNAALLAVSINVHQVARSLVPLFTMALSYLIFREAYPLAVLPPVLLVIVGVAGTVWGEMHVTTLDLIVVFSNCVFSSLKGILTQRTQVGSLGLSSFDLLRYICPLAVIQLLLVSWGSGELSTLMRTGKENLSITVIWHLSALGVLAFGLNFVSFKSAALVKPLTLNITANLKQVVTSGIGLFMFGGMFSATMLCSITMTALGAGWYSYALTRGRLNQVS